MKQPRIHDFDPNAKERKLNSSMDDFPVIQKPPQSPVQPQNTQNQPQYTRTIVPPVPLVPPRRKIKQRHPFDIYEDQLEELKKLSLEDRMRGGIGSMSAMVREAIDTFVNKKRSK
ncbi:MAG: hypothetical protein Q7R49_06215 [Candidatus Daviesbacteria bacterium]|nr:hypothetical protein [Candidatus Daviesbacteria bacterium]